MRTLTTGRSKGPALPIRFLLALLVVTLTCTASQAKPRSQNQLQAPDAAFINRLVANQTTALKALENYCYHQDYLNEKLSETGEIQRRDQRFEILCHQEGGLRSRPLTIGGKPTGAHDEDPWPPLKKDSGWLNQRARLAERNKRWLEQVSEVPRAAIFTPIREEVIDGRTTTLFRLTPNPQYKPKTRVGEMLTHLSGQAWLDMREAQMVRMIVGNDSDFDLMGGLLLKVRKGGSFEMRQRPFNGVWLTWYQEERWHARIALVKNIGQHQRLERSGFKPAAAVLGPGMKSTD